MRVAIIGAGVAGLSCAHELERNGIQPVIYERNSFIGEQMPHIAVFLEITYRPIKDILTYVREQFNIELKPLNTINRMIHHSPNKTAVIKGNLGYFFIRGRESTDLKNQLYSQLKNTGIQFNESVNYDALAGNFDYIVVASGNPSITQELGCWQAWFKGHERGATILGNFDPNTLIMWLNQDYCKNGYAFLSPYDSTKAFVTLVVPDVNAKELDHYWEQFLHTENFERTFIEEFKLEHLAGHVYPHQLNRVLFAGNAGGAPDPFLGFGQFNALAMGVMAARAIAQGKDYETLIKDIVKRNTQMYQFRKAFDRLTNKQYDAVVSSIGLPGIKHLLYFSRVNIAKYGARILRK